MDIPLTARRITYALLVAATIVLMAGWLSSILSADRLGWLDVLIIVAFSIKATWVILFFWHAVIGFLLMHRTTDPLAIVFPLLQDNSDKIQARTAVLMTVRDEDPEDIFARLKVIRETLDATNWGDRFHYFVLSDSSRPDVIAIEERLAQLERDTNANRAVIHYRRRMNNDGGKHGNLIDFCDRWGKNYDFMLVLDADSLMTADSVLRLVRIMEANPQLGILQSLLVGILAPSAFARVFEFGHRHGMRCSMMGAVWWQAERGQNRGHNVLLRVVPFMSHGRLMEADKPTGSRRIFGHDQVEAAHIHREGYEVWELPQEIGSFEEQPANPIDFIKRYSRWFYANLQNLHLIFAPNLTMLDRYHLAAVAHRFIAWPSFILFVVLAAFTAATWPSEVRFPVGRALLFYATYVAIYFTPRTLGTIDALISSPQLYGGRLRLVLGAFAEFVLTILFVPIAMVGTTYLVARALFGGKANFGSPRRGNYTLSFSEAVANLWPVTAVGCILTVFLLAAAPAALIWFMPYIAGLLLAVPFCLLASSQILFDWMMHNRFCAIPEDIERPREVVHLISQHGAQTSARR